MNSEEKKINVDSKMIDDLVRRIKIREMTNKMFGYRASDTEMEKDIMDTIDEAVRPNNAD